MRNVLLVVLLVHMLVMAAASAAPVPKLQAWRETLRSFKLPPLQEKVSTALRKKIPPQAAAIAAAGLVLCSSLAMTGCAERRSILDITDTEYVDPGDNAAGQYVTFYIDNQRYEGYWELTYDSQLLIEIDDGYGKTVLLEHMTGRVIPDHPDLDAEVLVYGERNGHDVDKYGEVKEVYDNGFYIIEIDEIVYVNSGQSVRNVRETLLINVAVLPEDGGFSFLDDLSP